jgi:signal transduction histidine kinase
MNFFLKVISSPSAAFREPSLRDKSTMGRKRMIIALNLGIIQLVVVVGLILLTNLAIGNFQGAYFGPLLVISSLLTIYWGFQGRHLLALSVNLILINLFLFLISQQLGREVGLNRFYVATAAAALVIYGFEHWKIGVGMSMVALILFVLTEYFVFDFIPRRMIAAEAAQLISMISTCLAFVISTYCVMTMLRLNYETEKGMQDKQLVIEQQNAQLKKANEELDRFVYSASHDLRAPLSSIGGLVTVMEMEDPEYNQKYLGLIKNRIRAMDHFIQDIINYSHNTRMSPSYAAFDLRSLVREVKESLQYFENAGRVKFALHIDDEFSVWTDRERLRVVLNNLLANSIKYADLTKPDPTVEVSAHVSGEGVIIEIRDNGIGIDQQHLARVFDMFYRATERATGSGLGLYIVKEIVEKLGGKVSVSSLVSVGTTFRIELPHDSSGALARSEGDAAAVLELGNNV